MINFYILNKMGWIDYSKHRFDIEFSENRVLFENYYKINKDKILSFLFDKESKKCYTINEKQNTNILYNFVVFDFKSNKLKSNAIDFESNQELLKLVIKYNACNTRYQRYFNINKILK